MANKENTTGMKKRNGSESNSPETDHTPWQKGYLNTGRSSEARSSMATRNQGRHSDLARPMDVFDAFAREMDSLFESFGIGRMRSQPGYRGGMRDTPSNSGAMKSWRNTDDFKMNTWNPTMEAFYEGDKFVVCADLPGMKKEQIDCRITSDNMLILSGERQSTSSSGGSAQDGRKNYVTERSYGTFRRTMSLPDNLDTEKVSATFEDGVLRLEVEVNRNAEEEDSSRRIEIG